MKNVGTFIQQNTSQQQAINTTWMQKHGRISKIDIKDHIQYDSTYMKRQEKNRNLINSVEKQIGVCTGLENRVDID